MSELVCLQALAEVPGVFVARKGALRSTLVTLKSGGVCIYSPVAGMAKSVKADLQQLGPLTHILAPNHYHHKAVAEFCRVFPKAKLCAPDAAHARLQTVSGLKFGKLETVESELPKHLTFVVPAGLKTGEVWLRSAAKKLVCWFVVDALCGDKMTTKKDRGTRLSMLKTFPTYGVDDAKVFSSWLQRKGNKDKPMMIVPCHGSIVTSGGSGANLAIDIKKLANSL